MARKATAKSPQAENRSQGCIIRIQGLYDSLRSAERKIADYILANQETVVNLTMEELESRSSSSYATIYRFSRKLGFSGFKELKRALLRDVMRATPAAQTFDDLFIRDSMELTDIVSRVFAFSAQILDDCSTMINLNDVQRVVELMKRSGRIFFLGAGTSGVSAQYAYIKFVRIGLQCHYEADPFLTKMRASILSPNEILFAISSSGRTRQVVEAARIAKKRRASVIALTDYAVSPLSKIADVNLYTTPRNLNHHLRIELPLLIGQIAMIDIIEMCCIAQMPTSVAENYRLIQAASDTEKVAK